ncbi:hypothetical protein ACJJH9_11280 [Microbulbifer sp. DLAB2-AF]|uniref:hypothetical protein n=1 Tax=Microbulbifer sp. DLAB2-AF TaxID=3243395 RepID=UPI0040391FFC
MKNLIFLVSICLLSACSNAKRSTPVIIADGTEATQFENLVFCGNANRFAKVMGDVGSKLGDAWDQVAGSESQDECTVRIKTDKKGNILSHEVVTCENPGVLPDVMAAASPVPVPENDCLLRNINSIKYGINSAKKNS